MKRQALAEAKTILDRANAIIENSVREIREQQANKDVVRTSRREVAEVLTTIEREQARLAEPATRAAEGTIFAPGDSVTFAGRDDVGEIVDLSHDGSAATVVFGIVRMRVPASDLRRARERPTRRTPSPDPLPDIPADVTRDLDLRGMTGDEALPLVDKFIDTAILAGLRRVDIIHGKGTGALRKKVTEFLSHDPRVLSYRFGEWNEGGTGATVVEIRDQ
jgi:DNA mismatch repair protein MutS2